jgi:hypothetical protein
MIRPVATSGSPHGSASKLAYSASDEKVRSHCHSRRSPRDPDRWIGEPIRGSGSSHRRSPALLAEPPGAPASGPRQCGSALPSPWSPESRRDVIAGERGRVDLDQQQPALESEQHVLRQQMAGRVDQDGSTRGPGVEEIVDGLNPTQVGDPSARTPDPLGRVAADLNDHRGRSIGHARVKDPSVRNATRAASGAMDSSAQTTTASPRPAAIRSRGIGDAIHRHSHRDRVAADPVDRPRRRELEEVVHDLDSGAVGGGQHDGIEALGPRDRGEDLKQIGRLRSTTHSWSNRAAAPRDHPPPECGRTPSRECRSASAREPTPIGS